MSNKRSFFRLSFAHPLGADFKVIGETEDEDMKQTKIAVCDMSAGGMRFITAVDYSNEIGRLFEIRFVGLGKPYKVLGQLLRCRILEEGVYEMSSSFSIPEHEEDALTSLLNNLSIKLRKSSVLSNCSFCSDEELAQLRIRT